MDLGELVEWAVMRAWSRRWVLFRRTALVGTMLVFPVSLVNLLMWYVHWKTAVLVQEFNQILPTIAATPTTTPTP